MRTTVFLLLILQWLVGGTALAQGPVVWSGGIGLDERAAAPATGTRLVFFDETGDFLANVHVIVKDNNGKIVVDTISVGPWLILNLEAGTYRVRAEVAGKAQGARIEVGGTRKAWGFRFPAS